jgi:hypothetical protein
MKGMIILRAEARLDINAIEYIAHSIYFEELHTGQETPEYTAEITELPGVPRTVKWVKSV